MYRVKWVVRLHEFQPVEVETSVHGGADVIVSCSIKKLPDMRTKHPDNPPDGFLVCHETGVEVRRWFRSTTTL
jgi:ribose 1,5-bisphosphokinase PhnN